jgi:hypothetical protein
MDTGMHTCNSVMDTCLILVAVQCLLHVHRSPAAALFLAVANCLAVEGVTRVPVLAFLVPAAGGASSAPSTSPADLLALAPPLPGPLPFSLPFFPASSAFSYGDTDGAT